MTPSGSDGQNLRTMRLAHLAGAAVAGAGLGAAAGVIGGMLPHGVRVAVLAVAIVWVFLGMTRAKSFPPPRRSQLTQVPRGLLGRFGAPLGQALWGAQLGSGFGTFVSTRSFWLVPGLLLNVGVLPAIAGGIVFAVAREGVAVWLSVSRFQDDVFSFLLARRAATAAHVTGSVLSAGLALWLVVT